MTRPSLDLSRLRADVDEAIDEPSAARRAAQRQAFVDAVADTADAPAWHASTKAWPMAAAAAAVVIVVVAVFALRPAEAIAFQVASDDGTVDGTVDAVIDAAPGDTPIVFDNGARFTLNRGGPRPRRPCPPRRGRHSPRRWRARRRGGGHAAAQVVGARR